MSDRPTRVVAWIGSTSCRQLEPRDYHHFITFIRLFDLLFKTVILKTAYAVGQVRNGATVATSVKLHLFKSQSSDRLNSVLPEFYVGSMQEDRDG